MNELAKSFGVNGLFSLIKISEILCRSIDYVGQCRYIYPTPRSCACTTTRCNDDLSSRNLRVRSLSKPVPALTGYCVEALRKAARTLFSSSNCENGGGSLLAAFAAVTQHASNSSEQHSWATVLEATML